MNSARPTVNESRVALNSGRPEGPLGQSSRVESENENPSQIKNLAATSPNVYALNNRLAVNLAAG